MKKKNKLIKQLLIDYVRFYYMNYLKNSEIRRAIECFELLMDEGVDVRDFIPVIRKMQYDLDFVGVENNV